MQKEKNIPTLNKLFIELEQVVTAKTRKEMIMEVALQKTCKTR